MNSHHFVSRMAHVPDSAASAGAKVEIGELPHSDRIYQDLYWKPSGGDSKTSAAPARQVASDQPKEAPSVDGTTYLIGGVLHTWAGRTGSITSPIYNGASGERVILGKSALLTSKEADLAVQAASAAYNKGRGEWPRMAASERVERVERFLQGLRKERPRIVELLMWEICKVGQRSNQYDFKL